VNLALNNGLSGRLGAAGMVALGLILATGCNDLNIKPPSGKELEIFEKAGPVRPSVDVGTLTRAKRHAGAYRVVAGDVLELQIPNVLPDGQADVPDPVGIYQCRVMPGGRISLPIVGLLEVAGKTLAQIESTVVAAYYPKYVVNRPPVVARVAEYHTLPVTVVGAVACPGLYRLRSDEMSLVALLMKAGGIVSDGAGVIRICKKGQVGQAEPLALPIKGLNIPFEDVALSGGELVEVERLNPQLFTVMGLVGKPGAYPYPRGARYNLLQAFAFAGGVDDTADPRCVRVYRQDADGKIVSALFPIPSSQASQSANVFIKPGDVLAVEHTPRTRARRILAQVFQASTGLHLSGSYSLNPGP